MDWDTKRWIFDITVWTLAVLAALLLIANAEAAEHSPAPPVANAEWQTECGSCHLAYPPQLLSATLWRAIMNSLDKHFGSNASLEPKSLAQISAFLERNAGRDRPASNGPPVLRITQTGWFAREHAEIPAAIWAGSNVKRSDCTACHREAAQGYFDEHTLRLPR